MANEERHIIVIGGGIIGCSTAYFLTRHPSYNPSRHKITILEATEIAGGASGKAGGLLALWAYPSSIVPLSYNLHAELAREHNGKERWGYREVNCGQLAAEGCHWPFRDKPVEKSEEFSQNPGEAVSLEKRGDKAARESKSAEFPEDLDWFDAQALKSYEAMGSAGETAQVHPYLFTTSMAQLAEEKGARIVLGQVTRIDHSEDSVRSVTYMEKGTGASQTIPATDVVIAAGPWTRSVFPRAPISALRAHSVVVRPTRPVSAYTLFTNLYLPAGFGFSSDKESGRGKRTQPTVVSPEIYARPDDTIYACGEGDTTVPLPETTADVQVDPARCQDIIASIGSVSKVLREGEVIARQACYLPNVDVSRAGPLIGHVGIRGLFMATGHTCWGIQNAPGTGKLVSEFVFEGQAKSASISGLDPRKYL
ncbi:hypothetical protein AJ78_01960 [Emergomyces pasteurianus Ep9510]|uniref:FAD dependent oxidoreductase domain-containing protein n=1 Tax=Emergomyces pasteurianus Ep9510 TaxID=1447872 RepID=A0A1J9QCR7_9EURO|nr:hypothetical protein AJ78_01960 [Emergomyces pasteurianus Ep9510]